MRPEQLDGLIAAAEQRGRLSILQQLVHALRRDPHADIVTLLDVLIDCEPEPLAGERHHPPPRLV